MSGYRISLDIAKSALNASQNAIAIAGHNIANVSSDGYSRQSAQPNSAQPVSINRLQYGRGVNLESIQRDFDGLLEKRLLDQSSNLAAYEESLKYIDNLETLFNINSENELSSMISEFWNQWHGLSNNPSGSSERTIVYEYGQQISDRFVNLRTSLGELETHVTNEIETGVGEINNVLKQIASLNAEINTVEASRPANDQRDSRGRLIKQLTDMMSVNTIEQSNGFITLMTTDGYPLVIEDQAYELDAKLGRVIWPTSSGGEIDISDNIDSGKLSGWLRIKEEVIAKEKTELDAVAKEFIWQVNQVHSQGTGLKYISSAVSGTYQADDNGQFSTLQYGHRIDYSKDFKMWIQNNQSPPEAKSLEIDMGLSTSGVTYQSGSAFSSLNKYEFTVITSGTVGDGVDDPVIAVEKTDYSTTPPGITTPVGNVTIADASANNLIIDGMRFNVDPGYLVAGNTFTINTGPGAGNIPNPLDVTNDPSKTANSVLDNYIFKVTSGGGDVTAVSEASPMIITWTNSSQTGIITLDDPADLTVDVDGMELTFNDGMLFNNDVFTITTNEEGFQVDDSGNFSLDTSEEWHWTLASFKDQFNSQATTMGASITAYTNLNNTLKFDPTNGYSFTFSDNQASDSGVMAALGINTFFTGDDASHMGVNDVVSYPANIAAAKIDGGDSDGLVSDEKINDPSIVNLVINGANNTIEIEENGTLRTITLTNATYTSYDDLHSLANDIQSQLNSGPNIGAAYKVEFNDEAQGFVIQENDGSDLENLKIFWSNTPGSATALGYKNVDTVYIPPVGVAGIGNNENAIAMVDLQYEMFQISQWSFERGSAAYSDASDVTIEGFYNEMLSALGIESAEIKNGADFSQVMVNQMNIERDAISGVSLDEEMINLINFQQSYTAASKLITTVDEMLQTLMNAK